ncbi:hypothetical protein DS745_06960 [Anaerobacillus alkaliphilus]|uniref:Uncharacterized protein n=1 Tax=Anaerobacillus alkaliphilus TaxID=1548597 RepID=A0A4Q0VUM3_9BACI|nr:hypothetical protein [Anaerobacillus alkaliphilus]RXJ02436.1 hypothetical protein DS745_06960 [Anaerobacillus alkaliphilus]
MLIVGHFEHSIELEQALAVLEENSVQREHIIVVFMDNDLLKSKYREFSPHPFEIGISTATGFAVFGASVGFVLTWGPILCGLFAAIIGFLIGYLGYSFIKNKKLQSKQKRGKHEVTVIIQSSEEQSQRIREILWQYQAHSVGQVKLP